MLIFHIMDATGTIGLIGLISGHLLHPANTKSLSKVGSMLAHRLRRWSNIEPTLGERLVFAGCRRWPDINPIGPLLAFTHHIYLE